MKQALMRSVLGLAAGAVLLGSAEASELLFLQNADGQSTYGPSLAWPDAGQNSEVADDFEVTGSIERISASGFIWGAVNFQGLYVRFYAFGADNEPGDLQAEYFFAEGNSNLVFDSFSGEIEVTLPTAFAASGRHFLSVQPIINYWYWWSANTGVPRGESFYFRDNANGETWHHGNGQYSITNADVSFCLYGATTGPGKIQSLSTNTIARSGFLEIFGSNLGASGSVLIGSIAAHISYWSSTRIIVYVPEAVRLGPVPVQVITAGGASNTNLLIVIDRPPPDGHVNWRFRMDGPYSLVRPAIGPDNTIYAVDAFAHLYAIAPDGGLKWVVRAAGEKGVAVGSDGTIYVASEPFIKAFNPDGSEKWTFVQNPRSMICLGVSVGPDGNIYSVGTEGPGVFSLTPGGQLRWSNPEGYRRPIVDYSEIVFGPSGNDKHLYFYANNHIRALRLDGTPVFTIGSGGQPVIAPDGSVHVALGAYSPAGALLWNFLSPYPYNRFSAPDVGSDGIHYFVQNTIQLFALNTDGSQRWHATLTNYVNGPVIDPSNNTLVMGGANTLDYPGTIQAASAQNGASLWVVTLPPEDPTLFNTNTWTYGYNQEVTTRGRFSKSGDTVYFMTCTATGNNDTSRSFLYSLNLSSNTPALGSNTLRITAINLSVKSQRSSSATVRAVVTVKDSNGASISAAAVTVKWTLPSGLTVTQTVNTSGTGIASFVASSRPGTYTLTVTNVRKGGFDFDAGNSLLTKSLTTAWKLNVVRGAQKSP
jgi:hypothetical protein